MPTGPSMAYVSGSTHVPVPTTDDLLYRRAHTTRPPKPTGLDWGALRPACSGCGARSSEIGTAGLCPACLAPAPAPPAPRAVTAPSPRPARAPRPPAKTKNPPKSARVPRASRAPKAPRSAPVDEKQMVVRYQAGETAPELARAYGCLPRRVYAILDRAGVERRDDRATRSGGRPRVEDPALVEQVKRLYTDEQLSRTQVADRLGIGHKRVVTIMERHAVPARTHQSGRLDGSASMKQRMADLGVTSREIKEWALKAGLIYELAVGLPPARLVDAYAAAHGGDA